MENGMENNIKELNGHYCLATKEHYDKLFNNNDLYVDGSDYHFSSSLDDAHILVVKNNTLTIRSKTFTSNTFKEKPMHLHNNEWVFGALKPIRVKIGDSEGYATQEFINDHVVEELAYITGSLEHDNRPYREDCKVCKGKGINHGVQRKPNKWSSEPCTACKNEPKPVERITREELKQHIKNCRVTSLGKIQGQYLIFESVANKIIDDLCNKIEYLEANQKDKG